jgi:nitroimidazol reductase NimA-like FMN-containing flavoprotein (pyridoxamine 5'-phosphate oxidase superfamily)
MTDAERDAFLQADPPYVGCVATTDEHGFPHAVPVWYRWDAHAVELWSVASLRWPRNAARDPRIAFTVFEHGRPYRAVYVKGRAELVTGSMTELADRIRPIVARYSADADATMAAYDDGSDQVAVTIVPSSIAARANASS